MPRADMLKICADDLAREITMMNEGIDLLCRISCESKTKIVT